MISYLAVVILILLKINVAISIPIRILRQTKGTRISFFLSSDIDFCISYGCDNNSLSVFQCFRYGIHYISLNKICIVPLSVIWRMTCWPQRCTDVVKVEQYWFVFLRTRKRRPSILILCPDNVTKRKWQVGGYRKEIMRPSWNDFRVATSHFFGKYGSLVRSSKIGQSL